MHDTPHEGFGVKVCQVNGSCALSSERTLISKAKELLTDTLRKL